MRIRKGRRSFVMTVRGLMLANALCALSGAPHRGRIWSITNLLTVLSSRRFLTAKEATGLRPLNRLPSASYLSSTPNRSASAFVRALEPGTPLPAARSDSSPTEAPAPRKITAVPSNNS